MRGPKTNSLQIGERNQNSLGKQIYKEPTVDETAELFKAITIGTPFLSRKRRVKGKACTRTHTQLKTIPEECSPRGSPLGSPVMDDRNTLQQSQRVDVATRRTRARTALPGIENKCQSKRRRKSRRRKPYPRAAGELQTFSRWDATSLETNGKVDALKHKSAGFGQAVLRLQQDILSTHFHVRPITSEIKLMAFLTQHSNRLKLLPKLIPSLKSLLLGYVCHNAKPKSSYALGLFALLRVCATTCAKLKTMYLSRSGCQNESQNVPGNIQTKDRKNAKKKTRDLKKHVRKVLSHLKRKILFKLKKSDETAINVNRV